MGVIESEGCLGENAIADYLDWENQLIAHLDAPEVLLTWDADKEENEPLSFPNKLGFTQAGYNHMKLLPY